MTGATDFLYFSIVTQRTPLECGGWTKDATRRRGLALAVTWTLAQGGYRTYFAADIPQLITGMSERTVVGYQTHVLDYRVIEGHTPFKRPVTLDLADVVEKAAGRKVGWDAVMRGTYRPTGRERKPCASATDRTALWQDGNHQAAEHACRIQTDLIRWLHMHMVTHGWVAYVDDNGERSVVDVPRALLNSCIR